MRVIEAAFENATDFLRAYRASIRPGGLFVRTGARLELGSIVYVDVSFPELARTIRVKGLVVWRRLDTRCGSPRAGVGLQFCASEQSKQNHLLLAARSARPQLVNSANTTIGCRQTHGDRCPTGGYPTVTPERQRPEASAWRHG